MPLIHWEHSLHHVEAVPRSDFGVNVGGEVSFFLRTDRILLEMADATDPLGTQPASC